MALHTDIRLLNDMEKERKLVEKPHCVDIRLFDGQVEAELNSSTKKSCIRVLAGYVFVYVFSCIY